MNGFTVVELLVIIVVISILVGITVVGFSGARHRANDTQRLSDARTIVEGLRLYNLYNRSFPAPTSANGSWEESFEDGPGSFMEYMVSTGVMNQVPVDPVNSNTKTYRYYRYPAGSSGCDSSKGAFFVLGILDMETSGRPHLKSPGWSCPSRDWANEFDWVTGAFESP